LYVGEVFGKALLDDPKPILLNDNDPESPADPEMPDVIYDTGLPCEAPTPVGGGVWAPDRANKSGVPDAPIMTGEVQSNFIQIEHKSVKLQDNNGWIR
jgi:hypothetical protein